MKDNKRGGGGGGGSMEARAGGSNYNEEHADNDESAKKKKAGSSSKGKVVVSSNNKNNNGGGGSSITTTRCCQAESCTADLTHAKQYHKRHRVCEHHAKAHFVIVAGITQRFCQQCSRFHEVSEFDEAKRSCRRRLAGHNERRRKNPGDHQGEGNYCKSSSEMNKEMMMSPHTGVDDHDTRPAAGRSSSSSSIQENNNNNNNAVAAAGGGGNYKQHFHILRRPSAMNN